MLTDRQRVEIALPARLLYDVAQAATEDRRDAEALAIKEKLLAACLEPLAGLSAKEARKVARRVDRAMLDISRPFVDRATAGKVAMTIFYFVEALITEGILELFEGSAMADAINRVAAMLTPMFEQPDLDASAKKQGRHMLAQCRHLGLYAA